MERRDFLKLAGIGTASLVLPVTLKFNRYTGKCKMLCEHCTGEDSHPLTNPKYHDRPSGPLLCEYHGTLIKKLKLLRLHQLEYIAKNHKCKHLVKDIMHTLTGGPRPLFNTDIHRVRLIAMEVSDEYFVKNHRRIFGC